jgi:hypothetical protein
MRIRKGRKEEEKGVENLSSGGYSCNFYLYWTAQYLRIGYY